MKKWQWFVKLTVTLIVISFFAALLGGFQDPQSYLGQWFGIVSGFSFAASGFTLIIVVVGYLSDDFKNFGD